MRNSNLKTRFALAAVALLCLSLLGAGCGDKSDTASSSPAAGATGSAVKPVSSPPPGFADKQEAQNKAMAAAMQKRAEAADKNGGK